MIFAETLEFLKFFHSVLPPLRTNLNSNFCGSLLFRLKSNKRLSNGISNVLVQQFVKLNFLTNENQFCKELNASTAYRFGNTNDSNSNSAETFETFLSCLWEGEIRKYCDWTELDLARKKIFSNQTHGEINFWVIFIFITKGLLRLVGQRIGSSTSFSRID